LSSRTLAWQIGVEGLNSTPVLAKKKKKNGKERTRAELVFIAQSG
jgi:hypothetical protein